MAMCVKGLSSTLEVLVLYVVHLLTSKAQLA